MKNIGLKIKYKLANLTNKYHIQEKGDTSCFRYPHLTEYYQNFDSDLKNDIFLLVRDHEEALFGFARENIEVLSNLSENAYFAYIFNILNLKVDSESEYLAYQELRRNYKKKSILKKLKAHYHVIDFNKIKINENYKEFEKYIHRSKKYKTIMIRIKEESMRDIAVSVHGTNILFIDKNDYNYGIGLVKAIINNENGIKGRNNENLLLEETYAKLPYMALYHYMNGYPKQDPDKTFMIAYLSLAFQKEDTMFSGLYAILEPFMKLLFSTIDLKDLLEYVIHNDDSYVKKHFNAKYEGFYEKIYGEKNIFKRMDILKEMALYFNYDPVELYKILFNKEHLVNTNIDYHVLAFIYLNSKVRNDDEILFDLIYNCYPWSIQNNEVITLENWSKHILLKYGEAKFNKIKKEYKNTKDIIEKL